MTQTVINFEVIQKGPTFVEFGHGFIDGIAFEAINMQGMHSTRNRFEVTKADGDISPEQLKRIRRELNKQSNARYA